jgi:hypothetical protein
MANGLTDQYQALYDAQLPQLELAARQAQQARGMFYSGDAVDAETKAKADLLAKILAQQASDTQAQTLQQAQINQAQSAQENQSKATARATNMGLIGTGAAAGLGILGTKLMQQPVTTLFQDKSGNWNSYNPVTKTSTPITVGGATLQPGAGIGGPGTLPGPSDVMDGVTPSLGGMAGTVPPVGAANPSVLTPSPWSAPGGSNGLGGLNPGGPSAPAAPNLFSGGGSPDISNLVPSFSGPSLDGLFSGGGAPDLSNLASSSGGAMADIGNVMAGGLPAFAKGGIVSKPTLATIGDAGPGNPEEVIPLNKLQGAIGPAGAARVMAAVPQPGAPGYGQPPGGAQPQPQPGMAPQPQPSMWSAPSSQGVVPPPAPMSPLAALQSGGLLGNLFNRPRPA